MSIKLSIFAENRALRQQVAQYGIPITFAKRSPQIGQSFSEELRLTQFNPMDEDQSQAPLAEPSITSPLSNNDSTDHNNVSSTESPSQPTKSKSRKKDIDSAAASKRRCVSTACIACRRRKSKVRAHLCLSMLAIVRREDDMTATRLDRFKAVGPSDREEKAVNNDWCH